MTIHSSTDSSIHPVTELPHGPGTQQDSGNSRSNQIKTETGNLDQLKEFSNL